MADKIHSEYGSGPADMAKTSADVLVVVSFFNRGEVLSRTVDSLWQAAQRANMGVVVVDDHSNPALDLQPYSNEVYYPGLQTHRNATNKGVAATFCDVINAYTADNPNIRYVGVFGSGDVAHPDKFSRQLALMNANPSIVATGTYYDDVTESEGRETLRAPRHFDTASLDFNSMEPGNVFTQGTVLYRRDAYEAVGGYRGEFLNGQDFDLWYRLMHQYGQGSFATVPEPLYDRFCRADDGVSFNPDKAINQRRYYVLAKEMALMSPDQQEEILAKLRDKSNLKASLAQLVPLESPSLQAEILKYALDAHGVGLEEKAQKFLEDHFRPPLAFNTLAERQKFEKVRLALPQSLYAITNKCAP